MSEKNDVTDVQVKQYEKEYSETGFWDKVKGVAKKAGKEVIYNALKLYYALQSENISAKEKAMIVGALGYFIFPIDIIPDAIPLVGYTDDAALLLAVLSLLKESINEDVKKKAKDKLSVYLLPHQL